MKNPTNDTRLGRPSASGWEYYRLCPGRFQMEQGQPDQVSPAASAGTRIHKWLEETSNGVVPAALPDEELIMAEACERDRRTVMRWVWPDNTDLCDEITEHRMWYRRKRFSGMADLVAHVDGHYLILDYKTGPVPVPEAEVNWQLKALSALVYRLYPARAITRAIVQPLCGGPTIATAEGTVALNKLRREVLDVLRKAESPDAVLRPGTAQCKYCKAKPICPALHEQGFALSKLGPVEALTPDQMGEAMDKLGMVKTMVKALEGRAKELLTADGNSIPGWKLREGSRRRSVENSTDAVQALIDLGILDEDSVDGCLKVELGKLEKAVARDQDVPLPEAKALVEAALGVNLVVKRGSEQLCQS